MKSQTKLQKVTLTEFLFLENLKNRWAEGIIHHPKSKELMEFLQTIDFTIYNDHFCWKTGGDGDNGEQLMYQMDAYFEAKDKGIL